MAIILIQYEVEHMYVVTIEVISKSKFKNSCFTGGFKSQYTMNTSTDVTKFWSNQIITQKNNYSNVIFPKLCIQIDIHLMSHLKVKQVGVTSKKFEIYSMK